MIKVFAIEGPDGVGKSTLIRKLKEEFSRYDLWLDYTAQPSGQYREKLLNKDLTDIEQIAIVKESRLDALVKVDEVLITDRWDASTFIYQALRNGKEELLLNIDRDIMVERKMCNYEVNYIFINLPSLISYSRLFNEDRQNNKFDSIEFEKHDKLVSYYNDLFKNKYDLDSIRYSNIFYYEKDEDLQGLVNWIRNKITRNKYTHRVRDIKLQIKCPHIVFAGDNFDKLENIGNELNDKGFMYTFSTFNNEPIDACIKNDYQSNDFDILTEDKEFSIKTIDTLFDSVFFNKLYSKYFNKPIEMIPVYKYNNAFLCLFGEILDTCEKDNKIDIRITFKHNKHEHVIFANMTNRGIENISWSKAKITKIL